MSHMSLGSRTTLGSQRLRNKAAERPSSSQSPRLSVAAATAAAARETAAEASKEGTKSTQQAQIPKFMSASDVRTCRDAFERFDKDNSGSIDTKVTADCGEELCCSCRSL